MSASAIAIGRANSQTESDGIISVTPPPEDPSTGGQTIPFVNNQRQTSWYAIRATQRRAHKVYSSLLSQNDNSIQLYFPQLKKVVYSNDDFDNPTQTLVDVPLDPNLLFMRCSLDRMLYYLYDENNPRIPGLTPYYNHCVKNPNGRNALLVVPDHQMESFRIIIESGNEHIITDQSEIPEVIEGDEVVVIGGPFAGVRGKVLKFKGQKRVFVDIPGLGCFGTAYVPKDWIRKVPV